ncbi:hypothetical protein DAI22_04g228150 [Oryza sativa Japonica Group]|nr:hypothetical protein DAI22_04g228150 [Oryza sativa Japonica Group]
MRSSPRRMPENNSGISWEAMRLTSHAGREREREREEEKEEERQRRDHGVYSTEVTSLQ